MIDWETLSQGYPVLAACPEPLQKAAEVMSFSKGELLYRRGERPKAMLWVLAGEVQLLRRSLQGSEIILQRVRGGFVAEGSLETEHYHCDVVAVADGMLLYFPLERFRAALFNDSLFHLAWSRQLAREVRKLRGQCERLSLRNAAERILHYIETEGQGGTIYLKQSRKSWAAELGITHEVLYRTLRDLTDKRILRIEEKRVTVTRRV